MVKSMTGFGRCETEINGRAITVEIKSVNHRYFEFSCRVTRGYGFLEDKLKAFVNSRVSRGKIDMFVSVGAADDVPCEVAVNHSLVSGYLTAMKEISDAYGIENDATVVSISRFPDVFTVSKAAVDEEQLTADVLSAAGQALDSFVAMREAEGERMKADILGRAQTILDIVSEIEERSPQTVVEYETRLLDRIRQTLENLSVALAADRNRVRDATSRQDPPDS